MNRKFLLILKILFFNLLIGDVRSRYLNEKYCSCKYNTSSLKIDDSERALSDELNFVTNIYEKKKLVYPLGVCAAKYRLYSICTGSLVSFDWVLTSSACASLMQNVDPKLITFYVATGYNHDLSKSTFIEEYHRQIIENYTMSDSGSPGRGISMLKLNKPFELGIKTRIFPACFHKKMLIGAHSISHKTIIGASYSYRSFQRKIPNFFEVDLRPRYLMKTKFKTTRDYKCENIDGGQRCFQCHFLDIICLTVNNRLCELDAGAPLVVEEDGRRILVGVTFNKIECQNAKTLFATNIFEYNPKVFIFKHTGNKICREPTTYDADYS